MIRYRPHRPTLAASLKDEEIFETLDEMLYYVFEVWSRVVSYMGAEEPFCQDEIMINGCGRSNPMTGYRSEHKIMVSRMTDKIRTVPICIGYCDFG